MTSLKYSSFNIDSLVVSVGGALMEGEGRTDCETVIGEDQIYLSLSLMYLQLVCE